MAAAVSRRAARGRSPRRGERARTRSSSPRRRSSSRSWSRPAPAAAAARGADPARRARLVGEGHGRAARDQRRLRSTARSSARGRRCKEHLPEQRSEWAPGTDASAAERAAHPALHRRQRARRRSTRSPRLMRADAALLDAAGAGPVRRPRRDRRLLDRGRVRRPETFGGFRCVVDAREPPAGGRRTTCSRPETARYRADGRRRAADRGRARSPRSSRSTRTCSPRSGSRPRSDGPRACPGLRAAHAHDRAGRRARRSPTADWPDAIVLVERGEARARWPRRLRRRFAAAT